MKQARVSRIETKVGFPIIVFGDTTGFTTFLLRTIDNRDACADYLKDLYNEICRFQVETDCYVKLECDGFISIHATNGQKDEKKAIEVLEACERLQSRIGALIKKVPYPRPEGFRIRVAGGRPSMDMRVVLDTPDTCKVGSCMARETHDTVGYAGVLADRMLRLHKKIPLLCCGAIYEAAASHMPHFEFRKAPEEHRVPDGVFKDDIQNLYSFKRKEDLL